MGLSVQNVSKTFGERKAVDSISFSIDEPGVFGLIGTNGARQDHDHPHDPRSFKPG